MNAQHLFTAISALPPNLGTLSKTHLGGHFHHIKSGRYKLNSLFLFCAETSFLYRLVLPNLRHLSSLFGIVVKSNHSPVNAHRSFNLLSLCNAASAETESFDVETQIIKPHPIVGVKLHQPILTSPWVGAGLKSGPKIPNASLCQRRCVYILNGHVMSHRRERRKSPVFKCLAMLEPYSRFV